MRRFLARVALALLAVMAAPSVAWADPPPPTVEDLPDFSVKFDAGEVCDFDLRIKSLQNESTVKTFYDAQGDPKREVFKGLLTVRIKNIETGDSQVRNWSGPIFATFNPDGSQHVSFPRRQVLILHPQDEGGPGLLYIRGPFDNTADVTPNGLIVNLDINGIVMSGGCSLFGSSQ